jgi:hypothetical protein
MKGVKSSDDAGRPPWTYDQKYATLAAQNVDPTQAVY